MIERIWIYLLFPGLPLLALYCFHRRSSAKRSNLKQPFQHFRRPAGYSQQEKVAEIREGLAENLIGLVFSATMPALLYVTGMSLPTAIIAGLLPCAFFLPRIFKAWVPYLDNKLGLLGEQITGAELDALQTNDVRAYHDLVFTKEGRTWNVDHILLTTRGILVIETKSRRKRRVKGEFPDKLTYDGKQITFPDGNNDSKALEQVRRNTSDLQREISNWTGGESIPVFPVLVFPGWKIEPTAKGGVYVVSHDEIAQLLPLSGELIYPKTFALLGSNLDRESRVHIEADNFTGTNTPNQTHHQESASKEKESAGQKSGVNSH